MHVIVVHRENVIINVYGPFESYEKAADWLMGTSDRHLQFKIRELKPAS